MSAQQADDLSAIRLVVVPDTGPPFDGDPLAGPAAASAAGIFSWAGAEQGIGPAPGDIAATNGGTSAQPQPKHAAGTARLEASGEWPRQFAWLLTEALAGVRPVRQILPWTSERARVHLRGLTPLFSCGQRPRVLRVIASRPTLEVIEMTVIVGVGARTRALAVRLEQTAQRSAPIPLSPAPRPQVPGGGNPAATATTAPRWVCTAIEAA